MCQKKSLKEMFEDVCSIDRNVQEAFLEWRIPITRIETTIGLRHLRVIRSTKGCVTVMGTEFPLKSFLWSFLWHHPWVLLFQERIEQRSCISNLYSTCFNKIHMNSMQTCHSVTFYFMKKDSKRCCDTTTPESIHTKDESKRGSAFAFIFGVNWPVQWM